MRCLILCDFRRRCSVGFAILVYCRGNRWCAARQVESLRTITGAARASPQCPPRDFGPHSSQVRAVFVLAGRVRGDRVARHDLLEPSPRLLLHVPLTGLWRGGNTCLIPPAKGAHAPRGPDDPDQPCTTPAPRRKEAFAPIDPEITSERMYDLDGTHSGILESIDTARIWANALGPWCGVRCAVSAVAPHVYGEESRHLCAQLHRCG